jgi:hypothetical protein
VNYEPPLTLREAAAVIGVSTRQVLRLVAHGHLLLDFDAIRNFTGDDDERLLKFLMSRPPP